MQKFSFHTHTDFSDGYNSIEEMLEQAVKLGWKRIGISDHLIVHKNIRQSPSWARWGNERNPLLYRQTFDNAAEAFGRRRDEIKKIAGNYPLQVLVGAEVDYFTYDGWAEGFDRFRQEVGLDYYITGNHYLQIGDDILDNRDAQHLSPPQLHTAIRRHFESIVKAVESGRFSFLAHLDYMRGLAACGDNFLAEKMAVVKALQKCGMATEISTKGLRHSNDYYPADNLLQEIVRRKIPLIISDDAHRPTELGFEFAKAEKRLQELNCQYRYNPYDTSSE